MQARIAAGGLVPSLHEPGTLIEGKYEILGKLREGGMGTLYRVRHRLLDEVRVVKVLKPEALGNEEMKRRFVEEARTATRLKHPNICTIHDFALDEEGKAYLIMEFIDGVNLADLLRAQGPRSLGLSLEVAHQTLSALAYLHRKSVVHRDIAPDNLMLTHDEEGRPLLKLIDLGIAKTLDRPGGMTSTGVFLGKLKYASPEQFGALPTGGKLDGRSDLYSLGVVLYELLTGKYPFAGESPSELLRAHLFDPPLPFSKADPDGKVPPEARAALLKALEKRREDRFASAEEFDREVVSLQRRYSRPDDLDDTAQILTRLRAMPGAGQDPAVTPSAQGRLDRQFVVATTPHPTSTTLRTPPDQEKTEVFAGSAAATPETDVETRPLRAPPPSRRPAWVVPLIVAAGVLAAAALASLGVLRRQASVPLSSPAPVAPTPSLRTASVPTAALPEPTAAPILTAPPQPTAPAPAPTPRELAKEPPRESPKEPAKETRRLRLDADQARARAASFRERAVKAHAPEQAAALYDFGLSKEREGRDLLARGQFAAATAAFDASRDSFERSEQWSRNQPATRTAPPERVAAARETPRHEPQAALPAPTAAPTPSRPATSEPPRGSERDTDEDRIRDAIRRYEKAQSTLDPDLYAAVYPSVDKARVRAAFSDLRSQTLEFEIQKIEVAPGGTTAVVRGHEERIAAPRVGSEQHLSLNRVLWLEKRGETWVITKLGP